MTNHLMTLYTFFHVYIFFSSIQMVYEFKIRQTRLYFWLFVFLVIWLSANTIFILLKEVYDDSLSPATKESHINLSQVAKKEK